MKIKFERWPWQPGYSFAAIRGRWQARFGGGWMYSLGVQVAYHQRPWRGDVIINLLLGCIVITWGPKK